MRNRALPWLAAAVLASAPAWMPWASIVSAGWLERALTPAAAEALHFNLKLRAPVLAWLGLTIAAGLAASAWMPTGWPDRCARALRWAGQRTGSWGVIVLVALAAATWAVNRWILGSFMGSADEFSCRFLAECLRRGLWYAPAPPLPEFFEVGHVVVAGDRWVSVYPPGWPLALAAGLELGIADALNPLMSAVALALWVRIGRRLFGSRPAVLGAAIAATTPFFVFTGAAYFSHATALLTTAVFVYAALRRRDAASPAARAGWSVIEALALGYGLATRPLTAAALAGPFVVHRWARIVTGHDRPGRAEAMFALVLALAAGLTAWHNAHVTGSAWVFPAQIGARAEFERLGFSERYTAADASAFLLARLFLLTQWMSAAWLVAYFASWAGRTGRDPYSGLVRVGFPCLAAAYFFYHSWGGNQFGPRYYYEALPMVTLSAADWVCRRWRSGSGRTRRFLLVFVALSFAGNAGLWVRQAVFIGGAYAERRALYDAVESTVRRPALVFVRGPLGRRLPMSRHDVARNHPLLETDVLYANDLGDDNVRLTRLYPDRLPYRAVYDPLTGRVRVSPL